MNNKKRKIQSSNKKGDEQNVHKNEIMNYYLKNIHGSRKNFLIKLMEIMLSFENGLKRFKLVFELIVFILVLNAVTKVTAGVSIFEIILNSTEDTLITNLMPKGRLEKISLDYIDVENYRNFKDVENKLNIELLKPTYIPLGFKLEKIGVSKDKDRTNFRVNAIYLNEANDTSLVYNAYVGTNSNINVQIIQEKIETSSLIEYFKCGNLDIPYNIFENTDWYSATWNYNNIIYELYGIKSKDELFKIVESVCLESN